MKRLFLWTAIILPVLFLDSCTPEESGYWIKISGNTQGTTYNITYHSVDSFNFKSDLEEHLKDLDMSLSTYIDSSLISRFNQGEKFLSADRHFQACFNESKRVHKATNGAFDITLAPIVNAWGFGFTERSEITPELIDSLKQYVGMEKAAISIGNLMIKESEGVMLDMNAIAQGYSVDILAERLSDLGITNYLVEIGGELKAKGHNPRGRPWRVGIDRPIEGMQVPGVDLQAIIELSDRSLATSGNYRRFYEQDGIKYSHTIDPQTGYPVRHGMLSVTVLTEDCMRADAYATAFMVMGFEKSVDFLLKQGEMDAYLIYNDDEGEYKVWYTLGMKKILVSVN